MPSPKDLDRLTHLGCDCLLSEPYVEICTSASGAVPITAHVASTSVGCAWAAAERNLKERIFAMVRG